MDASSKLSVVVDPMAVSRRYGMQVGYNAALVMTLAARPQGTTMGEIRSHTGQNQYNVFKRAEELKHLVIRKGNGAQMHLKLIHRDDRDSLPPSATTPTDSQSDERLVHLLEEEQKKEEAVVLTFSLERDLQLALRRSLSQLEPGLKEADGGSEEDFRDITAWDKDGNLVVIELKAVKARNEAVAQLLTYMGEVAAKKGMGGDKVRGILVAPHFQEKAITAASMLPNVTLKTYRVSFVFGDA